MTNFEEMTKMVQQQNKGRINPNFKGKLPSKSIKRGVPWTNSGSRL